MKLPTLGKGGWGLFPMQVLLCMFLIPLVESWNPWKGWRIGEASRPGPEGGDRSQISQKNKKTRSGDVSLLKKAKHKGTTSSWERGVYTNTAPQGVNLHLKRVTHSTHPDMRKLQRLRPNAQNP